MPLLDAAPLVPRASIARIAAAATPPGAPSPGALPPDATAGRGAVPPDTAGGATAGPAVARDVSAPAAPAPEPARRLAPLAHEEALARLGELRATIAADRADGALWSPERQRLLLLGWISHARSVEEASRGDREVHATVREIAREIGGLSKTWWPGSVQALQLGAAPCDCRSELALPPDRAPRSWLEVAEEAEARLAAIEERDAASGRDEHGWVDAPALVPVPPDAEARLHELEVELARAAPRIASREKDLARRGELRRVDAGTWERLASRARWASSSPAAAEPRGTAASRARLRRSRCFFSGS